MARNLAVTEEEVKLISQALKCRISNLVWATGKQSYEEVGRLQALRMKLEWTSSDESGQPAKSPQPVDQPT